MGRTKIEWTAGDDGSEGETWNPVRGCSVVSPGCHRCYARVIAARFSDVGRPFHGFALRTVHGPQWTGEVALIADHLGDPLTWREPRRAFVNSMSDLFHEGFTNEQIAAVFGVMSACQRHTFQVLTKRSRRMGEWFEWAAGDPIAKIASAAQARLPSHHVGYLAAHNRPDSVPAWPLPNVWIGVSAEDQQRADERIPDLLATPAAIRFVSYEPALGPVDFNRASWGQGCPMPSLEIQARQVARDGGRGWASGFTPLQALDWVIGGSESGPGARPMDVAWIRSAADQCIAAGVPFFTKQIATNTGRAAGVPKGGDPAHWPPGVWPREFPQVRP